MCVACQPRLVPRSLLRHLDALELQLLDLILQPLVLLADDGDGVDHSVPRPLLVLERDLQLFVLEHQLFVLLLQLIQIARGYVQVVLQDFVLLNPLLRPGVVHLLLLRQLLLQFVHLNPEGPDQVHLFHFSLALDDALELVHLILDVFVHPLQFGHQRPLVVSGHDRPIQSPLQVQDLLLAFFFPSDGAFLPEIDDVPQALVLHLQLAALLLHQLNVLADLAAGGGPHHVLQLLLLLGKHVRFPSVPSRNGLPLGQLPLLAPFVLPGERKGCHLTLPGMQLLLLLVFQLLHHLLLHLLQLLQRRAILGCLQNFICGRGLLGGRFLPEGHGRVHGSRVDRGR
mmetsp:Transcript_79620/g.140532  ORF Transcript_79620/g.140532 Transcript_79620/m.140532 type:complete len:341 (-) Transcript_79620:118-1140(-)